MGGLRGELEFKTRVDNIETLTQANKNKAKEGRRKEGEGKKREREREKKKRENEPSCPLHVCRLSSALSEW